MDTELSIIHLILEASLVVKLVMLVLMASSLVSWVLIFNRNQVVGHANRAYGVFEERFWSGVDLTQLFRQVNADPDPNSGAEAIFRSGFKEFTRARQHKDIDIESSMTAIQRAMRVVTNREADRLDNHLSFLATVGSTAPYVGLFGTVWGIMNSFMGLGNAGQATLATVAPGIAEALIATAIGLFAAIPAVIAYNRYSAQTMKLVGLYETFGEEFSSILHQQLVLLRDRRDEENKA